MLSLKSFQYMQDKISVFLYHFIETLNTAPGLYVIMMQCLLHSVFQKWTGFFFFFNTTLYMKNCSKPVWASLLKLIKTSLVTFVGSFCHQAASLSLSYFQLLWNWKSKLKLTAILLQLTASMICDTGMNAELSCLITESSVPSSQMNVAAATSCCQISS